MFRSDCEVHPKRRVEASPRCLDSFHGAIPVLAEPGTDASGFNAACALLPVDYEAEPPAVDRESGRSMSHKKSRCIPAVISFLLWGSSIGNTGCRWEACRLDGDSDGEFYLRQHRGYSAQIAASRAITSRSGMAAGVSLSYGFKGVRTTGAGSVSQGEVIVEGKHKMSNRHCRAGSCVPEFVGEVLRGPPVPPLGEPS